MEMGLSRIGLSFQQSQMRKLKTKSYSYKAQPIAPKFLLKAEKFENFRVDISDSLL